MNNVLYIQIDEDISSVLQRIGHFKKTILYLVVPKKSILFQSSVNLGILKQRCEENQNQLILVTGDRIGENLAKNVGLKVQNDLLSKGLKTKKITEQEIKDHPIQARRNQVPLEGPHRIQKKFTIGQLIQELREKKVEEKDSLKDRLYASLNYSRPIMLGFIASLSLALFFLISYIALPAATISIRPAFESLTHSVNVILAEKEKNPTLLTTSQLNVIPAQVIESVAKETRLFSTTSKKFEGVNATGQINIINTSREDWELIPNTRFQSPEGLIFRIQEGVTVPPAKNANTPGTLTVSVVADEFDIYGEPAGERGNIAPGTFIIPALSAYNQKRIWGENPQAMTGGVTAYSTIVLEEDIEAAKKQLEENLTLIAKEELTSHLEDLNKIQQSHMVLLNEDRYISSSLKQVRIPEGLEGSNKEKFEVYAEVEVKGIAYDSQELFALLKRELEKRAHPDMMVREDSIDLNRLQYEFVDKNQGLEQMEKTGQIKLTVTVDGIQEYVIDSSLEAGLRFSKRVKEKVVNLPLEEAKAYINNLPEVEEVEIKMWPVWLKKIPRLTDKIEVKLLE